MSAIFVSMSHKQLSVPAKSGCVPEVHTKHPVPGVRDQHGTAWHAGRPNDAYQTSRHVSGNKRLTEAITSIVFTILLRGVRHDKHDLHLAHRLPWPVELRYCSWSRKLAVVHSLPVSHSYHGATGEHSWTFSPSRAAGQRRFQQQQSCQQVGASTAAEHPGQ